MSLQLLRRALVCVSTFAIVSPLAFSQEKLDVTLEGRVEAVYLSIKVSEPVYAVELSVESVTPHAQTFRRDERIPSLGDTLFATFAAGIRRPSAGLPVVGQNIRAELSSDSAGKWVAAGTNWFNVVTPQSTAPSTTADDDSPIVNLRGMSCEAKILGGHIAFEVKSVEQSGPAHNAGFQVGDVVTAIDGKALSSVGALRDLAASAGELELTVVDINTSQLAKVKLASAPARATRPAEQPQVTNTEEPNATAVNSVARISASLGITVSPSRIGIRKSAMAVTEVSPMGGGKEAGLEVGDMIMAVNDQAVTSVDEFATALPATGGKITLLVRDSRSGEDVPVEAICKRAGTDTKPEAIPPVARNAPTGPADSLGLSTELTFYQAEAAVQVVAVQPGSAASRAGLAPGMVITAVNDKPVMHPDELKREVSEAQGRVRLTVVDPHTKRETNVDISR